MSLLNVYQTDAANRHQLPLTTVATRANFLQQCASSTKVSMWDRDRLRRSPPEPSSRGSPGVQSRAETRARPQKKASIAEGLHCMPGLRRAV